jgi:hypothetical protein
MKNAGAAVSILVALGTAALGQTPRTDIQGYYIGETFPEFAAQSGLDLAMCSGANDLTKPQRRMCKNAAEAQKGKEVAEDIAPRDSNTSYVPYHFLFEGGKLVLVATHAKDFSQVLADTKAAYGPPAKYGTVRNIIVRSGYRAVLDTGYALWNMPDGVVIAATEKVDMGAALGPASSTDLTFCSAEKQKELDAAAHGNTPL